MLCCAFFCKFISKLEIQTKNQSSPSAVSVRIPLGISYWTPAEEEWRGSLSGIAGVRAGIELYPHKKDSRPEQGIVRPFGRVLLNWRIGAGDPNTYGAKYNGVGIQAGLFLRLNITSKHGIYFGISPAWAAEFYQFTPKHDSRKSVTKRGTAVSFTAGYNFKTEGRLSLFCEVEYSYFFSGDLLNVIVPTAGISIGL